MVHTARIKGSGWVVCIGGFRGVKVDDVDGLLGQLGTEVSPNIFQLFDADHVAGWEHIYFSAVNAVKAFETETAVSKSLAIEILLYASCQDQIAEAFTILGISPTNERVALLVMGKDAAEVEHAFKSASKLLGNEDDSVLHVYDKKFEELRQIFSISDIELQAVAGSKEDALIRLIIERGALLPVRR